MPLHSTMFLLIPTGIIRSRSVFPSLHSTMFLLIRVVSHRKVTVFPSFTFHYVSINTYTDITDFLLMNIFTFHYVSINTEPRIQTLRICWPLHSTMFLLIQDSETTYAAEYLPLHSTMFLLIPAPLNHRLILPYYTIFCRPWYFFIFLFISI